MTYLPGYSERLLAEFRARQAARQAAFLLPHLHPGQTLLDVGCGPGALTINLAEYVAPGRVVGVDLVPAQMRAGELLAIERGLDEVTFAGTSAYALPFARDQFDVVFAHALLYHLPEPRRALAEFWRVLKPGGLLAVRDFDTGGSILEPSSNMLRRADALYDQVLAAGGGDPSMGPKHRALLLAAGFEDIQLSASYDNYNTPDVTTRTGDYLAELYLRADFADTAIGQGWATPEDLQAMARAWSAWGRAPGAYSARRRREALARKPLSNAP